MASKPVAIPRRRQVQVRELHEVMQRGGAAVVGPDGHRHEIPREVYGILLEALDLLQEGQAISVVPSLRELTTQEAANLLGMSRQFFVRLLDAGELRFHRTGTHRRVCLKDVLEYQAIRGERRRKAIENLAKADVAAGIYDKVLIQTNDPVRRSPRRVRPGQPLPA